MKLSLTEQETIIRYDRAGKEALVYTFEPSLKRKLATMAEAFEDVKFLNSDNGSVEYMLPKNLITIRKPHKKEAYQRKKRKLLQSDYPRAERKYKICLIV